MITIAELETIAQARLLDAEALIIAERYDGAAYICGYAIELSLRQEFVKRLNGLVFLLLTVNFKTTRVLKCIIWMCFCTCLVLRKKSSKNKWAIGQMLKTGIQKTAIKQSVWFQKKKLK